MKITLIKKENEIKTRFILNPFLWFTIVWLFVLVLHTFDFTRAYPSTSGKMYGFLIAILLISLGLAVIYHIFFLKKLKHINITSKPIWIPIIFAYFIFIVEAIFSRQVPIISVFLKQTTYKDFGVPLLSGFMYSFCIFLSLICSLKLVYGEGNKWKNFIALLLAYGRFVLVYSRGGLILCVLITLLVFLSKRKLSFWWIPALLVLAVVGLWLFNIIGNIRMGYAWNDSSYLLRISQFRKSYYWLKDFSWGIVYLDTPLGNLLYNERYVQPLNDYNGLISQLFPSVISERLFPNYDSTLTLAIPNLTVSSMFAGGYKYYGYVGMVVIYIEMVLIVLVSSLLCKKESFALLGSSAFLSLLCAMSFFDNMFYSSGNSFALIYLIIYIYFFYKKRPNLNYTILVSES